MAASVKAWVTSTSKPCMSCMYAILDMATCMVFLITFMVHAKLRKRTRMYIPAKGEPLAEMPPAPRDQNQVYMSPVKSPARMNFVILMDGGTVVMEMVRI